MSQEVYLFSDIFLDSKNISKDKKESWVYFECFFYFLERLCKTKVKEAHVTEWH